MAIRLTSFDNGHTHSFDDSVTNGTIAQTSPPTGEQTGHTHGYEIDANGVVSIYEAEGHTHVATDTVVERNRGDKPKKERHMPNRSKRATLKFEVKQVEDIDDKFYRFRGFASTGDIDLGNDKILDGAFSLTIANLKRNSLPIPDLPNECRLMPILWQHDMEAPLGSFTNIMESPNRLEVEGVMPKTDTFVVGRVIPQMKVGSIGGLSIGYIARDFEFQENIRVLKTVELIETSLVTIPMNPNAIITDLKTIVPFQDLPLAPRDRPWDASAAVMRLRTFLDSEEEPGASYRRGFLYFDESASGEFGSYKLPIADVIDDRLFAIPRAIFAAAGTLRGARGGVDIPEQDKPGIINNVERYYEKLGLDSPFMDRNCLRIDELSVLTERELESLFKSGVVLSGNTAKRVVSALKSFARDETNEILRDAELKKASDILDDINLLFND